MMNEPKIPFAAKWRTSMLKRYRQVQRRSGRHEVTCSYFSARYTVNMHDLVGYEIAINRHEYINLASLLNACARLRPSVFIDVGANLGLYSCAVGARKLAKRIVSFEPDPHNYAALQHNAAQNNLLNLMELRREAVGSEAGSAMLEISDIENKGLSAISTKGTHMVPVVSLDDVLSFQGQCIAIKIDVEGFEAQVLQGATRLLRNNTGYAQIEARSDAESQSTERLMTSSGWRTVGRHGLDVMFERQI